jgi:phosphate transport system ATP-binding protein
MVFQRPNPLPLTVYENVVFGCACTARARARQAASSTRPSRRRCSEVGLWKDLKDRLRRQATALQLEQQQKLCIARLLPLKPDVILMDEPVLRARRRRHPRHRGADVELRGRYTIVIVTHNMAQARRASDECYFMLLGEVVEHGRTQDLFLKPKNAKTADYIEGRYG